MEVSLKMEVLMKKLIKSKLCCSLSQGYGIESSYGSKVNINLNLGQIILKANQPTPPPPPTHTQSLLLQARYVFPQILRSFSKHLRFQYIALLKKCHIFWTCQAVCSG